MHGPQLNLREIAAAVHGAVRRLERLGIPRELAIQAVAKDNNLDPARVAWLIEHDRCDDSFVAVA